MTNPTLMEVAVLALATGRVSYSITSDTIFRPLRERVWRWSAPETATDDIGRPWRMLHTHSDGFTEFDPQNVREIGFFGELVSCPYCASFWLAHVVALAWILWGGAIVPWVAGLALWALATLYARWIG